MRYLATLILLQIIYLPLFSQNDAIAYSVNGQTISKQQLQKDFDQYKKQFDSTISIEDYVDSQIQKKIIEEEALKIGVDTSFTFQSDVNSVKKNLLDKFVPKPKINYQNEIETYKDRMKYQLELNHLIVPFKSSKLFPNDTLVYYNEALKERKLAEESGFKQFEQKNKSESFGVVFDLEDYSGYMGWISPLMYTPDVDNILFDLKIGEISMPVRTSKGYHIFQVVNKRVAQGDPTIEMVIFNVPKIPAPSSMIDSVRLVAQSTYEEILVKNNFDQICQEFLQALGSTDQDCPSIEINLRSQLPYPIINEAFQLKKIGDVSKPILTDYGFALIRLKDKKPPITEPQIDVLISETIKNRQHKALKYKEMMRFYTDSIGVKINQSMYDSIMAVANIYFPTDSSFIKHLPTSQEPLITIRDSIDYSVTSFKEYFKFIKDIYIPIDLNSADIFTATVSSIIKYSLSSDIVKDAINQFTFAAIQQELLLDVEKNNPDFKKQFKTFEDDLLYTNFYKQVIWNINDNDIEGLKKTYNINSKNYKLDREHWKGCIVFSNNEQILEKIKKSKVDTKEKLNQLIANDKISDMLSVETGSWGEGENEFIDYMIFKKGEKPISRTKYKDYIVIGNMIDKPKDFLDVYEQVKLDYQKSKEEQILKRVFENNEVIKNKLIIDEVQ